MRKLPAFVGVPTRYAVHLEEVAPMIELERPSMAVVAVGADT
jgi:hypothetical protein